MSFLSIVRVVLVSGKFIARNECGGESGHIAAQNVSTIFVKKSS